jgi:DNA (cytosine-5)-methyltransferase 1
MKHGSLFSGIGGFDLAAEWMGWENVFHCEWNEFGKKVLNYYWPKAISYHDITKTDFTIHRGRIDILTGGFPCQPYSAAGKRKGKEDDRHLWPEMCRAIREVQPQWVVGENVSGLVNWSGGLVFDEVQADLEAEGYEVIPFLLPAAGVGAPHKRERVWFVAYANKRTAGPPRTCTRVIGERGKNNDEPKERGEQAEQHYGYGDVYKDVANTNHERLQRSQINRGIRIGRPERDKQFTRCVSPDWQIFPTQPPICSRDDGLSTELDGITFSQWRNESIKAYGNAIVPAVVLQIFKAIEQFEHDAQRD